MSQPNNPIRPILFLGTTNLDVTLFTEAVPERGESVIGRVEEFPGGKGANQAVAAGRLGAAPLFATILGDDEAGTILQRSLAASGVSDAAIRVSAHHPSGRALIFVGKNGDNLIGIDPGANAAFCAQEIDRALDGAPMDAVLVAEMGLPLEACRHLFRNKGGRLLIFNPAPVTGPLAPVDCAQIDILTPNESEARALTGFPISSENTAFAAARALVSRGCRSVIITLGEAGAVYASTAEEFHVPAFRVTAVDTTAAGDAFNGGLAVALARQMEIRDAIRFGMAVAAISVTRKGAQTSMPTGAEVETFLMKHAEAL